MYSQKTIDIGVSWDNSLTFMILFPDGFSETSSWLMSSCIHVQNFTSKTSTTIETIPFPCEPTCLFPNFEQKHPTIRPLCSSAKFLWRKKSDCNLLLYTSKKSTLTPHELRQTNQEENRGSVWFKIDPSSLMNPLPRFLPLIFAIFRAFVLLLKPRPGPLK